MSCVWLKQTTRRSHDGLYFNIESEELSGIS